MAGGRVAKGNRLVSLEAMKMETIITAPHDGTVAGVYAAVGAQVAAGQVLVAVVPGGGVSGGGVSGGMER